MITSCSNSTDSNDGNPDDPNDFTKRTYKLHIPWSYTGNEKFPLVFAFHGAYSNASEMELITGFNGKAGPNKYIVCYPNAAVENWNEGCDCNKPHRLGIDDIGYIEYLIDKIKSEYNIDTTRIYAVGYSQGGLFATNVACKLSGKFAAVATVASTMSLPLSQNCAPQNKMPILMIHGTLDNVIPWGGSNNGSFSLLSAENAIKFWANINSCDQTPVETFLPDNGDPLINVNVIEYEDCSDESETILYAIGGGGHEWFNRPDIVASDVIIDFILKFSR